MRPVIAASRYAVGGRPARVVAVAKASLGAAVVVSRWFRVGAGSHELNVRSGNLFAFTDTKQDRAAREAFHREL